MLLCTVKMFNRVHFNHYVSSKDSRELFVCCKNAKSADQPNMRFLNHGNVVGAVADGRRHDPGLLDEPDHLGLLKRGHPATDDRVAVAGKFPKGC